MFRLQGAGLGLSKTPQSTRRALSSLSTWPSNAHPPLLRPVCRSLLKQRYTVPPHHVPAVAFHATRRNDGIPILLASLLKTSTALEIARTAGRIVLSLAPVLYLKNHRGRKILRMADMPGSRITSEEDKELIMRKIKAGTRTFHLLLSIPVLLFWGTIFASIERTPLTGRWRMIVLSPEEEDDIANQLAGPGWYQAVGEILAQDGQPRIIPPHDWRYMWVQDTLRRLESTIPTLVQEEELCPEWIDHAPPEDMPLPPPADYPLRPRPRASEYLRYMCESVCGNRSPPPVPHSVLGPPYSLLLVDKPDASNAFSYGFGPNGGGGIVVYSGFIDEILSKNPAPSSPSPDKSSNSWYSSLFGGLFPQPPSTVPRHKYPVSEEQTGQLAILLAHELAHLVLSHHLETLSSATVFIPGALSIFSDVIRVVIFPATMLFGPFVNDAVAQLGKLGSGEFAKIGEYCTSIKQEIEADVVSARLLAHAGFDARNAVDFWEDRSGTSSSDCATADTTERTETTLARKIMGASHPVNEVRVDHLKAELVRWETERRAAVRRLQHPLQESSILLAAA